MDAPSVPRIEPVRAPICIEGQILAAAAVAAASLGAGAASAQGSGVGLLPEGLRRVDHPPERQLRRRRPVNWARAPPAASITTPVTCSAGRRATRWSPNVAVELEYAYRNANADLKNLDVRGGVASNAFMANAIYTFDGMGPNAAFRPYLGAGLGAADLTFDPKQGAEPERRLQLRLPADHRRRL